MIEFNLKSIRYTTWTPTVIFENNNLKIDHNILGKWFIHDRKQSKDNHWSSLEHSWWLCMIRYMNYESDT